MQSTDATLAERRRLTSKKMHEGLTASSRRVADRRDRSIQLAAKCKAAIRPSPFFTKLPPEIRLTIYDFAYAGEEGSITVNFERKTVAGGKPLSCAFDPLIAICKEWFNEAFDSFVRSRQFCLGGAFYYLKDFLSRLPPQVRGNVTSIWWRQQNAFAWPPDIHDLNTFAPNVKSLHVFIGSIAMFMLDKDYWMSKFSYTFAGVMRLRGLRSFHATVDDRRESAYLSWNHENRSQFEESVAIFKQTIHDQVTRPKGT